MYLGTVLSNPRKNYYNCAMQDCTLNPWCSMLTFVQLISMFIFVIKDVNIVHRGVR